MNIHKSILLGALVACGAAIAATTTTPATTSQHDMPRHYRHGEMMHMPFMHAIHQLNLTPEQHSTIQGFMEAAHQQAKDDVSKVDMKVLANPGDPNYASAVATAKTNAANHIQRLSDLEVQVYGVLTAEQKAKLPQVLADMNAERAQHHADKQSHQTSPDTAG